MSIGAIWIVSNWLIEADFINYWKKFKSSPTIWMLLGILFFGLLSLMWSDDVAYGQKDLARKMPFFAIPFALGLGKPVEQKIVNFLLYIFIGMILLTSGINFYRYYYVIGDSGDIREMSYFISHIRFGIVVALGIFAGIYLLLTKKGPWWLWMTAVIWMLFYTWKSQTINGYVLTAVLGIFTWIYMIVKFRSKAVKISLSLGLLAILIISIVYVSDALSSFEKVEQVNLDELEMYTPSGREYKHFPEETLKENGHLVWVYVQHEELEQEWQKRSEIGYRDLDKKGQPMYGTLIRYMTSKNMRKDSVGVSHLSDEEIRMIENGCASINMNAGFKGKMHEFLWQYESYKNGGDPNGQSLLQRLEHLKTAWSIILKNGLFGVGIGDVPAIFDQAYDERGSLLLEENRHRSHNQFLTMWIALGLLGLIMLVGMLIIPLFKRKELDYFHWVVFITLFISCMFQDMLETQAGVTLFGLFYGITVYKEVRQSRES
ncbi:MAG: O-antigen ligase family protein [Crocinitomicaceae bacterium]|nr:O-antigen ligase family protein [Crocinitomicaceae bacterium]